jgi:hypothetical protein
MSDNSTDLVVICRWLRYREMRGRGGEVEHWVHPAFLDNLNSTAFIVSKELNQDPVSFYLMSFESFSLVVNLIGPQVRLRDTNVHADVSAEE